MANARALLTKNPLINMYNDYADAQASPDIQDNSSLTELFFKLIRPKLKLDYFSSTLPTVQFGSSAGAFFFKNNLNTTRKIIGYDFADRAALHLEEKGMQARCVDLNVTTPDGKKLACHDQITQDLAGPCNIFLIRIADQLTPEARKLLIFTLIDNAKPGSVFYCETFSLYSKKFRKPDFIFDDTTGFLPSFFGARTDMQFQSIAQQDLITGLNPAYGSDYMRVERTIIKKR